MYEILANEMTMAFNVSQSTSNRGYNLKPIDHYDIEFSIML